MSRYKVVKPKDLKYEKLKKRERIRKTVDFSYLGIMLLFIVICGFNQAKDSVIGWMLIAMGAVSAPCAAFHIYIDVNKWKPLFWYDAPELRQLADSKMREKDLEKDRVFRTIETVAFVLFSIGLPIEGILKLI